MSPYRELREIRKGAASLRREAARATAEGKKLLMASAHELEKLAGGMPRRAGTAGKTLEHAFARAHHALARHYHQKATEFWARNEAQQAGHELEAAALHLEQGLVWVGQEAQAGRVAVMKAMRLLAEKLITGAGWAPAEVRLRFKAAGEEIEKLGRKIKSAKGRVD